MVHVYCSHICEFDLAITQSLPCTIQKEINKFKFEKDKLRGAIGKYLLKYGLTTSYNFNNDILNEVRRADTNSKPFIHKQEICFNISHSHDFVVCAISKHEIGIDIEKKRLIELNNYESVLNNRDQELINKSANPNDTFFKIWSMKEAVMKADGRGMQIDAKEIYIQKDSSQCILENKLWHIQPVHIHHDYPCYFAAEEKLVFDIKFVRMMT